MKAIPPLAEVITVRSTDDEFSNKMDALHLSILPLAKVVATRSIPPRTISSPWSQLCSPITTLDDNNALYPSEDDELSVVPAMLAVVPEDECSLFIHSSTGRSGNSALYPSEDDELSKNMMFFIHLSVH